MRILHSALLLLTLAVVQFQAATPPSLSVVNLPIGGTVTATDAQGNIYFTGGAVAGGVPVTPGAPQTQPGGGNCAFGGEAYPCHDAYIAKVPAGGGPLVFSTLLGGAGDDFGTGIAVDTAGNVYITGTTTGGFPTTPGAFQPSPPVQPSIPAAFFVAKLNPQGTKFVYVTCLLSSSAGAQGLGNAPPAIAVDTQGNAYIAGSTGSSQTFVAKVSPDGSALLYDTLLGGTDLSNPISSSLAIAVDENGDAYVTGVTTATDFRVTPGAFQTSLKSCQTTELTYCGGNAFVAELNPSGKVVFATYLGGSVTEIPFAIQVDSAGYVYVAGETSSPDFPTTPGLYEPNALIPMWSLPTADSYGSPGGFAAKLSPAGDKLAYSTYVFSDGGVRAMTLDNAGGAYVAGITGGGVGVTASAPQPCMVADEDAFVTHLDSNGALVDRSYFNRSGSNVTLEPIGLALSGSRSIGLVANGGAELAELRFGDPGTSAAACVSAIVLNGATFSAGPAVSPGELITLTGFGMGPDTGVPFQLGPDGTVPRQLAGVQVFFGDLAAPLVFVQSQQINAIAPFELAGQTTTSMRLVNNGATIGSVNLPVSFAIPGLFRLQPGLSAQVVALNQDGTINGPSNPAVVGSVVSLFGTGFGTTNTPEATGTVTPAGTSSYQATVTVGVATNQSYALAGGTVQAEVLYAGTAPACLPESGRSIFGFPRRPHPPGISWRFW
jgi:uncharacterized protein (TIGR03437 family)